MSGARSATPTRYRCVARPVGDDIDLGVQRDLYDVTAVAAWVAVRLLDGCEVTVAPLAHEHSADVIECECGYARPDAVDWLPATEPYRSDLVECGGCHLVGRLCCGTWSVDGKRVYGARCERCCDKTSHAKPPKKGGRS